MLSYFNRKSQNASGCCKPFPQLSTDEQKEKHVEISQDLLVDQSNVLFLVVRDESFLKITITHAAEVWVDSCDSETQAQSSQ